MELRIDATILYVQGWRFYFYSNEGNEPMHVHAVKGDAECKYWLDPDRFDIVVDLNTTVRRVYDARCVRSSLRILTRSSLRGGSILEEIVHSKTKQVLAKAIETTPDALILFIEGKSVSIPWEKCSERLAHASLIERSRAELSPSGYGIHWPLIDEDLAVGPLIGSAT
jgi:hypothetical protein